MRTFAKHKINLTHSLSCYRCSNRGLGFLLHLVRTNNRMGVCESPKWVLGAKLLEVFNVSVPWIAEIGQKLPWLQEDFFTVKQNKPLPESSLKIQITHHKILLFFEWIQNFYSNCRYLVTQICLKIKYLPHNQINGKRM